MYSLGFLGAGWMGGALIGGIAERCNQVDCCFFDVSEARCNELAAAYNATVKNSIKEVMADAEGVVIAVKPQVYPSVADEIAAHYKEGQILISIMAGVKMETLGAKLPAYAKIIRLMPNMAMTVGKGVCLLSANPNVTEEEKAHIMSILGVMGLVKEIPEHLMDAGTAISGSGPAFFYSMVEAMMLGGVKEGFSRNDAMDLVIHTMKGAAALLEETGQSAGALRDQMMSAGGTTVEGVCVLEKGSFRGDVIDAVAAASRRSKELSGGGSKK
ncbi:MAG: pyrroline-5-carboxylate reductase [Firmicutes bacterium]|nr:pyrroline-5-carboxylate reductase [Bacillota bacterium]